MQGWQNIENVMTRGDHEDSGPLHHSSVSSELCDSDGCADVAVHPGGFDYRFG